MLATDFADLAARLLAPGRFFAKPPLTLRLEPAKVERRRWEIYKGDLVPPEQTREEATFHIAKLFADLPGYPCLGPILSLLMTEDGSTLHVLRGFAVHGHEAYGEGNVIQTRPAVKWLEERITTHSVPAWTGESDLRFNVWQALRGLSRLAITSVESPHPLYVHGLLAPCWRLDGEAVWTATTLDKWLQPHQEILDVAVSLDFALRTASFPDDLELVVRWWHDCLVSTATDGTDVLRLFFRRLALTPEVGQVDRLLVWLSHVLPRDQHAHRLAHWICQLAHHLTAFDLVYFHNQGANYPDACFLDKMLWQLCQLVAEGAAVDARVRRALRLGSWYRRYLEGLRVPTRPTSPGENARVSLTQTPPLAEEELHDAWKRPCRLFDDEPLFSRYQEQHQLLAEAWRELPEDELLEFGKATFLDRPLGIFKVPQSVHRDQTPLAGYVALSRSVAVERLEQATAWGWLSSAQLERAKPRLQGQEVTGILADDLQLPNPRRGVVALEDARQAAPDFVVTRSLDELHYELGLFQVREWLPETIRIFIRSPRSRLIAEPRAVFTFYDERCQPRLELGLPDGVRPEQVAYVECNGLEMPACGFAILHAWDGHGQERPLPAEPILVIPSTR